MATRTPDRGTRGRPPARIDRGRERRRGIAALTEERDHVRVSELASRFGVSEVTIRKDLMALQSGHRLLRFRGGAASLWADRPEREFQVRERRHRREKHAIGVAASEMVADGQTVAIDASTTALQVARALRHAGPWSGLTVVTNGLRIAAELAGLQGVSVRVPQGRVRGPAFSIVETVDEPAEPDPWRTHVAFVGASGFTIEDGLMEATEAEAAVKHAITAGAELVIAVVDHSKWGRAARASFCPTGAIDLVVTDAGATPEMLGCLEAHHVAVQLAHFQADATA